MGCNIRPKILRGKREGLSHTIKIRRRNYGKCLYGLNCFSVTKKTRSLLDQTGPSNQSIFGLQRNGPPSTVDMYAISPDLTLRKRRAHASLVGRHASGCHFGRSGEVTHRTVNLFASIFERAPLSCAHGTYTDV